MPKGNIPRSKSGKIYDYLVNRSNVSKPFRAAAALMRDPPSLTGPIRPEDIERSFSAAGLATAGSMVGKRPSGSVGTGGRQYKVPGATPQVKVTQPKPGSSKFIGPVKPKAKNKSKAQAVSSSASSSSSRYKVSGAQANYTGPKPKPGSKKFIGPTRPTQPGEKGFIGPMNRPVAGQANFIGPVRPTPKKKGVSGAKAGAIIAGSGVVGIGGGVYLGNKLFSTSSSTKKNIVGNNPNRGIGTSKPKTSASVSPPSGTYFVTPSKAKPKNIVGNNPNRNIADIKPKTQMGIWKENKKKKDAATAASKPPKPRLRPNVEPKGMTFQEAVRRNRTEEYTRAKMKPKGSLLGLLRKRKG